VTFGGIQTMWLIVLFDLPTDTKEARKEYTQFRKFLLNDGYTMMQYSVYMRHSSSDENAIVHAKRVKACLPDDGEVRIIKITDKQFSKIEVYYGKKRKPAEKAPLQLDFF
jgi:CRISPR-associated protein Cas2